MFFGSWKDVKHICLKHKFCESNGNRFVSNVLWREGYHNFLYACLFPKNLTPAARHVRMLPVTWGMAMVLAGSFGFLNYSQLNLNIAEIVTKIKIPNSNSIESQSTVLLTLISFLFPIISVVLPRK